MLQEQILRGKSLGKEHTEALSLTANQRNLNSCKLQRIHLLNLQMPETSIFRCYELISLLSDIAIYDQIPRVIQRNRELNHKRALG